jgi:bifunctional DNase/RNase
LNILVFFYKNFFNEFNIEWIEVQIYSLNEGVFHAKLICEQFGILKEMEARASDSIALAVRFKCPIYTFEDVMEEAGIILDASEEENIIDEINEQNTNSNSQNDLSKVSLEKLYTLLNDALQIEDYVLAAKIRDEIDLRN